MVMDFSFAVHKIWLYASLPVLLLTVDTNVEIKISGVRTWCLNDMSKPVNSKKLIETVEKILQMKKPAVVLSVKSALTCSSRDFLSWCFSSSILKLFSISWLVLRNNKETLNQRSQDDENQHELEAIHKALAIVELIFWVQSYQRCKLF